MQIVVSVLPVDQSIPGPPGPGHRVFSKNVVLERDDASTPGNGLPTNAQQRRVGSYSGLVTTLRVAAAISFISRAAISSNTRPYSSRRCGQHATAGRSGHRPRDRVPGQQPQPHRDKNIRDHRWDSGLHHGPWTVTEQPAVAPLPTGTENWLLDIP